jgi:hypothetical protein
MHSLTAGGTSSSRLGKLFNRKSRHWSSVGQRGKTCWPTKKSPTIPAQTLILNCCWYLEWSTPWGLSSALWWCSWKFMLPLLPKPTSPEKSTDKRKGGLAHCWTNHRHKFLLLESRQAELRLWTCCEWYGYSSGSSSSALQTFTSVAICLVLTPGFFSARFNIRFSTSGVWMDLSPSWQQKA